MVSVVAQISKYRNNNTYLWHGGVVLVRTVVVVGMMGAFQEQRGTVSKEERGKCNYWLERLHKKKRRLIEMSATTTT
jgi:hypothetical protein